MGVTSGGEDLDQSKIVPIDLLLLLEPGGSFPTITNRFVQETLGVSRHKATRILRRWVDGEWLNLVSRGRNSHYTASRKLLVAIQPFRISVQGSECT